MESKTFGSRLAFGLALWLGLTATATAPADEPDTIAATALRYRVVASKPRLNRKVTGLVTRVVQGVPAEPVDSMVYDGDGSVEIEGHLTMIIDPIRDVGIVQASWSDANGEWTYTQSQFAHPEHASGVRIGSTAAFLDIVVNEGIAHNVHLHGDTGAALPMMPTLFNHLTTWGPVDVTLDGAPFLNPFELPAPQWLGHLMVTEGVRHPDGTIRTIDDEIYNPSHAAEGQREEDDLEVHLVFHDERFPMTDSNPPLFSFFYHLVFEDVSIQIVQADDPIPVDPPEPDDDDGGIFDIRPHRIERGPRSP